MTFIHSAVFSLWIPDLEDPVLGHWIVDARESLIGRVGRPAYREQMQVTVPYPGYLKQERRVSLD